LVCCPISVVKTRVEGSGLRVYSNALQGLTTILRSEGVRGLYAGLLPSLLKDCPFSAVYLVLYTQCKTGMAGWAAKWELGARGREKAEVARLQGLTSAFHVQGQTPVIQFASAFLAASAATTLFQPLEVIKTRLQLQPAAGGGQQQQQPASSFHRFRLLLPAIYAEHGARGYFAGLLPRVIRRSLSNAIAWSLFEQIYQFWSGKVAV
jgi:solute carrier family 25 protein 38